jgi:hypothetical protein
MSQQFLYGHEVRPVAREREANECRKVCWVMPESQARFTALFNPSFTSWKRSPLARLNVRTVLAPCRVSRISAAAQLSSTSNVCRVFFTMMFKRRCSKIHFLPEEHYAAHLRRMESTAW